MSVVFRDFSKTLVLEMANYYLLRVYDRTLNPIKGNNKKNASAGWGRATYELGGFLVMLNCVSGNK